jgi:hypothetical protein
MATSANDTTCGACGKWTLKGANYCHHCAHPLKAQFNSQVETIRPATETEFRGRSRKGHWLDTDPFRYLAAAGIVIGGGAALAWLNDGDPGQGAILAATFATVGGGLLLLAKWYLERPRATETKPQNAAISVTLHEPLASGWRTYLDQFEDPSITVEDLYLAAKGVLGLGQNFSREAMVKAGLSQPKARKLQQEFLRLRYACPLPNGKPGYTLTPRGRKLLAALDSPPGK